MITALILFYGLTTLWTLFGVGHYPRNVLTLSRVLDLPLFSCSAICGSMTFIATLEAKRVAALALNITYALVLVFNAIVTPLVRAPAYILIIISVSLAEPLHVSLEIITTQEFQELRMWNDNIAKMLRTSLVDALIPLVDNLLEVLSPIFMTKLMITAQRVCLLRALRGELLIANETIASVLLWMRGINQREALWNIIIKF